MSKNNANFAKDKGASKNPLRHPELVSGSTAIS